MNISELKGLTSKQVAKRVAAGKVNKELESVSPSVLRIVLRNSFNLINLMLLPLLVILAAFARYKEVFVLASFSIINSLVGIIDEIRIKRRLDKIRLEFAKTANVIRDGKKVEINLNELVDEDLVIVGEGEGIVADGEIVAADYLQIDQSLLTGESDYILKKVGDKVIGGSFVVTGQLVYRASGVGGENYLNTLSATTRSYRREQSQLEVIGSQLTIAFVVASIVFGMFAYLSEQRLGANQESALLALVSVVMLVIPQTLIFLFTFSFSISVLKLSRIGVLVQRAPAIETMSGLDILCFDKTGTITTNEMDWVTAHYWNLEEQDVSAAFRFSSDKLFGKNKTIEVVLKHFARTKLPAYTNFDQKPFTSQAKQAEFSFAANGENYRYVYGAYTSTKRHIDNALEPELDSYLQQQEEKGLRLLTGVVLVGDEQISSRVFVFSLREELNQGIKDVFEQFTNLRTQIKIISGDSPNSVLRVMQKAGLENIWAERGTKVADRILNVAEFHGDLSTVIDNYDIFARAKPADKLTIIRAIQATGRTVGMVGDGVNDVLALKLSNLSIAMERGAKMARDVADVVLIGNDFSKMPQVLYEAENIIANLKYMNKLFLSKTLHAILFTIVCALLALRFPYLPSSLLVFSFFGTSLPSYAVAFSRRPIQNTVGFWRSVLPFTGISTVALIAVTLAVYLAFRDRSLAELNTIIVYGTLFIVVYMSLFLTKWTGYLSSWIVTFLIVFAINFLGVLAIEIPLVRSYYDLVVIDWSTWQSVGLISLAGMVGFTIVCWVWSRLFKDMPL